MRGSLVTGGASQDESFAEFDYADEDDEGEVLHLVTLWGPTKEEVRLYDENS